MWITRLLLIGQQMLCGKENSEDYFLKLNPKVKACNNKPVN